MPCLLVKPKDVHGSTIVITDRGVLHHWRDVLRAAEGRRVECIDGSGGWYAARIVRSTVRSLELEILERGREEAPGRSVRLLPALIKPDRFDWLVQKATELGVEWISPVVTERSLVKLREGQGSGRVARWARIAKEAAQQCGRATVPQIDEPVMFAQAVSQLGSGIRDQGSGHDSALAQNPEPPTPSPELFLLPTLAVATIPLRQSLEGRAGAGSITVLIGPEGDFTKEEVALAQRHGAIPVSLGRRTLRSETAAIAVLAVLQHAAGEL